MSIDTFLWKPIEHIVDLARNALTPDLEGYYGSKIVERKQDRTEDLDELIHIAKNSERHDLLSTGIVGFGLISASMCSPLGSTGQKLWTEALQEPYGGEFNLLQGLITSSLFCGIYATLHFTAELKRRRFLRALEKEKKELSTVSYHSTVSDPTTILSS